MDQQRVTLITEDDLENYGPEFIDLIKRAAKEALQPELIALSQEIHGTPSSRAAELITVDDVKNYGYSLIDLSKRAAKETIALELNALTQEISALKRKIGLPAAIKANTAPPAKLLTEQDEQDYGPELIDLLKRAGKEIAAPELNALKHEIACLKQIIGTRSTLLKSAAEITKTERADLLAKAQFDALTVPQKVAVGAATLGTGLVVGAGVGVVQAALAPLIAAVALPIGAPLLGLFYGKMALDAYRKHRRKKEGLKP
jgi:hypothetical protein